MNVPSIYNSEAHATDKKRIRIWHHTFVLPKDEEKGRKWCHNMNLAVPAPTLQESIGVLLKRYPEAVLYGVSHGGEILIPTQTDPY